MTPDDLTEVKKAAIIAMFSDDNLMTRLVLKGGNLLDIIYKIAGRASLDIDLSLEEEFGAEEIEELKKRIEARLKETYLERGYTIFDFRFEERPPRVSADMEDFWGGYRIELKVIGTEEYKKYSTRLQDGAILQEMRVRALDMGARNKKPLRIDISKFEYCAPKEVADLDGYRVYVYTPAMMVFEKLRAICQQMPEYAAHVRDPGRMPRARDFFDIFIVLRHFKLQITSTGNQNLLKAIFEAKEVPLNLIGQIARPRVREFHRGDFPSLRDTVKPGVDLKPFDYYFDFVVENCCRPLEPLWKV